MSRTSLVLIIARYLPQGDATSVALTDDIATAIRDHLREQLRTVPTIQTTATQALVSRRDVAMALGLSE